MARGGVTLHQQRSGLRSFDVTTDGVAHYGLYADWFRELELAADEKYPDLGGGDQLVADMLAGAENYLQMWERAVYGGNDGQTTPVDVVFDEEGRAARVEPHAGPVMPEPTPEPTPAPAAETVLSVAADGHDHVHAAPAASPALPATGGGLGSAALLLLGATAAGSSLLRGRRRPSE